MDASVGVTTTPGQFATSFWVLWSRSDQDTVRIQEGVDHLLAGYSFYPEVDWAKYGYRAPDGYQVLGAWRHADTIAFVFLLEKPRPDRPTSRPKELLIHAAGSATEINSFGFPIRRLKSGLSKSAKQELTDASLQKRLAAADRLKSTKRLLGLLSVWTAAINAFSLYLRKLPPPTVGPESASKAYLTLVLAVHFTALLLLLALIAICLAYTVKYGVILLRRL